MIVTKEVFTAEELTRSITTGDCRRLEENSNVAVDVRNAAFVWPYECQSHDNIVNSDNAGLVIFRVRLHVMQRTLLLSPFRLSACVYCGETKHSSVTMSLLQ